MSLKNIFLKTKFTYKIYLYYNLYIRHKCFINRKQYSQWGEDIFINSFFKDIDNGIYLDIGCFHPYMYSNTCLLYKKGWNGINVDINQTAIDLFNIVRPKDTNICAAASNKKRELKVYFDDPFSPVNTVDEKFYQKLEKSFLCLFFIITSSPFVKTKQQDPFNFGCAKKMLLSKLHRLSGSILCFGRGGYK